MACVARGCGDTVVRQREVETVASAVAAEQQLLPPAVAGVAVAEVGVQCPERDRAYRRVARDATATTLASPGAAQGEVEASGSGCRSVVGIQRSGTRGERAPRAPRVKAVRLDSLQAVRRGARRARASSACGGRAHRSLAGTMQSDEAIHPARPLGLPPDLATAERGSSSREARSPRPIRRQRGCKLGLGTFRAPYKVACRIESALTPSSSEAAWRFRNHPA
mmetsp:Transcript_37747/g.99805  ORF Transcript_37747/g.99805 Transcript_37747/m.99805 type:complete len:222 (+) Transcript_37747:752-1417(+)